MLLSLLLKLDWTNQTKPNLSHIYLDSLIELRVYVLGKNHLGDN